MFTLQIKARGLGYIEVLLFLEVSITVFWYAILACSDYSENMWECRIHVKNVIFVVILFAEIMLSWYLWIKHGRSAIPCYQVKQTSDHKRIQNVIS